MDDVFLFFGRSVPDLAKLLGFILTIFGIVAMIHHIRPILNYSTDPFIHGRSPPALRNIIRENARCASSPYACINGSSTINGNQSNWNGRKMREFLTPA